MTDLTPSNNNTVTRKIGKCVIVGAGDFFGFRRKPLVEDLIIAADGGLEHLAQNGFTPDIVLGDFDSLNIEDNRNFIAEGIVGMETEIFKFPKKKDDTDMMLAVKEGLSRGYSEFELYGCTGNRIDHLFANIQTLVYLTRRSASGWLYGKNYSITSIINGRIWFDAAAGTTVSVFAQGGLAEGITLSGFEYSLSGAKLYPDYPLGVSNKATGGTACIEVKLGTLLAVIYN